MLSSIVYNRVRNTSNIPNCSMTLLYSPTLIHLGWRYLRPSIIHQHLDSSSYKLRKYVVQMYFSYTFHLLSIKLVTPISYLQRHSLANRKICFSKIISLWWDKEYNLSPSRKFFTFWFAFHFSISIMHESDDAMADRLCRGLQSLVARFDSGWCLQSIYLQCVDISRIKKSLEKDFFWMGFSFCLGFFHLLPQGFLYTESLYSSS